MTELDTTFTGKKIMQTNSLQNSQLKSYTAVIYGTADSDTSFWRESHLEICFCYLERSTGENYKIKGNYSDYRIKIFLVSIINTTIYQSF